MLWYNRGDRRSGKGRGGGRCAMKKQERGGRWGGKRNKEGK